MTREHFFTTLVLCCAPVFVEGQANPEAPPDLVNAITARAEAISKADVATWERLTTQRFTVVNPNGHLVTRDERVAELKQAKPAAAPSACGSERITIFAGGNAASHRCLIDGIWWLEVWTKAGSEWQVVTVQGTTAAK